MSWSELIPAAFFGLIVVVAILTAWQRGRLAGVTISDNVVRVQKETIDKQSSVLEEQMQLIRRLERQRDDALRLCRK